MALSRWNPFKDIISLQERMSQIFDEAVAGQKGCVGLSSGAWSPVVDMYETDDKIVLTVEVPGVDIKDVDLEVNEDILTLRGVRRFGKDLKEEHYLRMERAYGAFQRVFNLPEKVSKDTAKAKVKDGVLTVVLKKKKRRTKQVKVSTG